MTSMLPTKKKLIIRLSSLGDVIMATSSLEVVGIRAEKVDWVVLREFAPVLRRHPSLRKVWEFDRKTGLKGWAVLARQLWNEDYDTIIDLHGSLRSRILRYLFFCWSLGAKKPRPLWKSVSKQRFRFWSLYFLKRFQPRFLRPEKMVVKFARAAGGSGAERPNLKHLLNTAPVAEFSELLTRVKTPYLCVMPGSKWPGKRWPVEKFAEVVRGSGFFAVILGGPEDRESYELARNLFETNTPHLAAVGKWGLSDAARLLAGSAGYLGNDTGLAHLAEALGVTSTVVFGPTVPEMGFGPWRPESSTIGSQLWCRPCGKDGRYCFRRKEPFLCMTGLSSEEVLKRLGGPV